MSPKKHKGQTIQARSGELKSSLSFFSNDWGSRGECAMSEPIMMKANGDGIKIQLVLWEGKGKQILCIHGITAKNRPVPFKFINKRRANPMKKRLTPGCLVLFSALVVLLGCATVPIKSITQADLPDLKGKWKGVYQSRGGTYIQPVELEIFNEDLKGMITFGHANRPATSAPFNGKIENGRIVYSGGDIQYINLNFRKGEGKMKLEGDYLIQQQYEGTISLDKVKE